jgi:hypothetical protein
MLRADFDHPPNLAIGDAGQTRYWESRLPSPFCRYKGLLNFRSILDR